MKKFAAVIAAGVIALGLAGCTPRTTLTVDEQGNITIYEEISFTKKDQATMGINTCDGILERLKSVDDGSWDFSPDRVAPGDLPEAEKDGALVCRFYSQLADKYFKQISAAGDVATVQDDTAILKLNSAVTASFKPAIENMLKVQGYDVFMPSLVIRMPGDITRAVNGGEKVLLVSGTDAIIPTDQLGKDLEVVSNVGASETVKPTASADSKKNTAAGQNSDADVMLGGIVLVVGFLLIVGLVVAVVVLVGKNRRLKKQNQGGGQPGGVVFPGVSG